MVSDVRRDAEDLARYYSELLRRLARNGVRDVADLVGLYEQLKQALDTISQQEIGWAMEQTQRLLEALVRMDANLEALRRLKSGLGPLPASATVEVSR